MPTNGPAVNAENGTRPLASGRHMHESASPGFIARATPGHIGLFHRTKRLKSLAKIVSRDIAWQIPYEDIHSVFFLLYGRHVFRWRARQERTRMTGLEAGGAVYGKRSCFKASSGDRPNRDKHTEPRCIVAPPGAHASIFFISTPHICKCPFGGQECGRTTQKTRRAQTGPVSEGYNNWHTRFRAGVLQGRFDRTRMSRALRKGE